MAGMTRRGFVWTAVAATASGAEPPVTVPLHRVTDVRLNDPAKLHRFWSKIWPEAWRDFSHCGIQFQCTDAKGEVKRSPGDRPIFTGLERGALNLVLTDHIPMYWDSGRALSGVTTLYEGYHLCVIAIRYAHGHQIPYLSVNTCVHELLHALLLDIFFTHPKWYQSGEREFRIDSYATDLWLFHNGTAIRRSARSYLARLRAPLAAGAASGSSDS